MQRTAQRLGVRLCSHPCVGGFSTPVGLSLWTQRPKFQKDEHATSV